MRLTKKEIACLEILCADGERHCLAELEEVICKKINMSIDDVKNFKHDELMCEVNEDRDIIFFEKSEPEFENNKGVIVMPRLTKEELEHYRNTYERYEGIEEIVFEKICNELIEYKDIEEKLGIDLITLIKAFSNGIYRRSELRRDYAIRFISPDNLVFDNEYLYELEYCYGHTELKHDEFSIAFEDYGKTWALTKEELEQ